MLQIPSDQALKQIYFSTAGFLSSIYIDGVRDISIDNEKSDRIKNMLPLNSQFGDPITLEDGAKMYDRRFYPRGKSGQPLYGK
jgi:hypothetical protein